MSIGQIFINNSQVYLLKSIYLFYKDLTKINNMYAMKDPICLREDMLFITDCILFTVLIYLFYCKSCRFYRVYEFHWENMYGMCS